MQGSLNESLIRKLTYLKIYVDVVLEGLGSHPFDPQEDLFVKSTADFPPEDIGLIGGNLDIPGWLETVRNRFQFILNPTSMESRWADCDPRNQLEVSRIIEGMSSEL